GGAALPGAESDHLASQGSLVFDRHHKLLIAVNAGSDAVSTFRVDGDALSLVNVVPSGGEFPASIAVHHDLVYVLNAGGTGTCRLPDRRQRPCTDRMLGADARPREYDAAVLPHVAGAGRLHAERPAAAHD